MKIPNKLKIAGHVYKVKLTHINALDSGDNYGTCDVPKQIICLNETNSNTRMRETLLHEILHAIDIEFGFGLNEQIVNTLGLELHRILYENKLDFLS